MARFVNQLNPVVRRLSNEDEDLLNRHCFVLSQFEHANPPALGEPPDPKAVPLAVLDDLRALSRCFWDSSQPILDLVKNRRLTAHLGPRFGMLGTLIGGAVGDLGR